MDSHNSLPLWTRFEGWLTTPPLMELVIRKVHQQRKKWYMRKWERNRRENPTSLRNFEAKVFSQYGEDGMLEEIFRRIGNGGKYCLEFGIEDGSECCTRNLLERQAWSGVLLEASPENANRAGQLYRTNPRVRVVNAFITAENVLGLFDQLSVPRCLDLLVIDIDGNDYWIWKRILTVFRSRVVVIEYNGRWPPPTEWVMPYDPSHRWDGSVDFGASLAALEKLGKEQGYSLVACNHAGNNAFFVLTDELGDHFPDHRKDPSYHYSAPLYHPGFGHPIRSKLNTFVSPQTSSIAEGNRPLPAVLRPTLRFLLRAWSRFPKATGYMSEIVERWGGRLATRPLECRLSNGMKMNCDLSDHVQRQIYFRGAYEPIEAYLFQLMLRPGMVVIDAGANVGQYALIAAGAVGHNGEVHAFEPVPRNFQRLEAHVLQNGLATIVRTNMKALWHQEEVLKLHLGSDMVGNNGAYTLGTRTDAIDTVTSEGVRLDDYVARTGLTRLDFVKMDIEGAELFALLGARAALERWRPTMLLEINRDACMGLGYRPEQVWDLLKPFGYQLWVVGQSSEMSRSADDLVNVNRANIIFHTGHLPDRAIKGWSLKSVLRYHRRKAPWQESEEGNPAR